MKNELDAPLLLLIAASLSTGLGEGQRLAVKRPEVLAQGYEPETYWAARAELELAYGVTMLRLGELELWTLPLDLAASIQPAAEQLSLAHSALT